MHILYKMCNKWNKIGGAKIKKNKASEGGSILRTHANEFAKAWISEKYPWNNYYRLKSPTNIN